MKMNKLNKVKKMRWYNKRVVQENTIALKIIELFCLDGLHCWPVKVFAVCIFVTHFIMVGTMIYMTSTLYKEGTSSKKFYTGGGAAMIVLATVGLLTGFSYSIVRKYPIAKLLVMTGSVMTLFMSIALMGSRGMICGCYGGFCAGMILGNKMMGKMIGLLIGGSFGFVVGGLVGAIPFFWTMDSIQRYISYEKYGPNFSEETEIWSRNFDNEDD